MQFAERRKRKIQATVELTPLIDVVFQLLIFFMLSATFVVQSSIPIEVPEAEGGATLDQKDLSITIAYGVGGPEDKGAIYVNTAPIDTWSQLSRKLAAVAAENPEVMVLLRPDARVPTERLVKVMGIANASGIAHYGIAAERPSEEE